METRFNENISRFDPQVMHLMRREDLKYFLECPSTQHVLQRDSGRGGACRCDACALFEMVAARIVLVALGDDGAVNI